MMIYAIPYLLACIAVYRIRGQEGWAPTQAKRAVWGLVAALPLLMVDPLSYGVAAVLVFLGLIATGHGAEQHYDAHLLGDGQPSAMELRKDAGWFQENADWPLRLIWGRYNTMWGREAKRLYKLIQAFLIGLLRGALVAVPVFFLDGFSLFGAVAFVTIAAAGYMAALLVDIPGTLADPLDKSRAILSPPNRELTVGFVWGAAFIAGVAL